MTRRLSIDWQFIERRRLAVGLSRAELADRIGIHGMTTDYLWPSRNWRDDDHDHIRLHTLERLCSALDVPARDLFTADVTDQISEDDTAPLSDRLQRSDEMVLEAALYKLAQPVTTSSIALTLVWQLGRVDAALANLEKSLETRGVRIDRDPESPRVILGVVARESIFSPMESRGLDYVCARAQDLQPVDASTLYEIAVIGTCPTEADRRFEIGSAVRLHGLRYLRHLDDGEHLAVADEVVFSLCLDGSAD